MAESVKVAVRVRPFNAREKAEGAELCVKMEGNMTKVWNKETGFQKEFFFDYSYWSHDGFTEDSAGFLSKSGPDSNYADQMTVFNDLGIGVLDNAWNGYHCCLFAYGQTGSGKSYSIVGYGSNKGIIPVACEEIFRRITSGGNPLVQYDVKVSMLEIYNEQVQDLLENPNKRMKGGLKIREHPKTGVYVEGLLKKTVGSYEQISDLLEVGSQHRTVAATQMNATSSRAHTVLTISFTQIFHEEGTGRPLNRKQSDINLVDLAGSERASKTGATGDRLAEGSNINKSLSTLGRVITSLAKNSAGGGRKEAVPYRESSLTRILQNALGGNSKTTMIAAISPATFNVEETISTLRYADQVKAIKNKAVVNETPQERLIRELREENERLKSMLEGGGGGGGGGGIDDDTRQQYEALIEQYRREKEEAEQTSQQRANAQDLQRVSTQYRVAMDVPHLQNLNEDPMLTGHIKHAVPDGVSSVGRAESNDIVLRGLGIGDRHCQIEKSGGNYSVTPSDANGKLLINGQPVGGKTALKHQDRIKLGNGTFFVFIDPSISATPEIDFEAAVQEANETEMKGLMSQQDEEIRRKEEEMQQKMQEELERARVQMDEERRKLQDMLAQQNESSQEAIARREAELLERQKQMEEEMKKRELELRDKEKQRQMKKRLDQLVSNTLQVSNEANERASMLGKEIRFKPEFTKVPGPDGVVGRGPESVKMRLRLLHPRLEDHQRLYWPPDRLEERLPDMAEMCQQYFDGTPLDEVDVGYDPFSIDLDEIPALMDEGGYIGQCNLITETLYHLLEQDPDPQPIYDPSGHEVGRLVVSIVPEIPGEDIDEEGYESLEEVFGKQVKLTLAIPNAQGIPQKCSSGVYCSYNVPVCGREVFKTAQVDGVNPQFNYSKEHSFVATRFTASDLQHGALTVNLFGQKPDQLRAEEINAIRHALAGSGGSPPPAALSPPGRAAPGNTSKSDSSFTAKPHPLSASALEESKEAQSPVKSSNQSQSVVVAESDKDRRIRELEERVQKQQKEVEKAKGSGCCAII